MVQKIFAIFNNDASAGNLYVEIGRQYVACWVKRDDENKIYSFELFQHDTDSRINFSEILQQVKLDSVILDSVYNSVQVIWQDEQCLIIPRQFFREDLAESFAAMAFGNDMQSVYEYTFSDDHIFLSGVPASRIETIKQYFPSASFNHKYQLIFDNWFAAQNNVPQNMLHAMFYQQHFILFAVKQKQLQLLNSFEYHTPEDALYHILNVCERLEINKDETPVFVSGLIDLNSGLYKQLHQYIPDLRTKELPAEMFAAEGFQQYPLHYFSSFCNAVV